MASPTHSSQSYAPGHAEPRKRLDVLGRRFARWWEEQESLDKTGERLTAIIRRRSQSLPGGQKTVDFLNGTFIGHPLHPLLTDLPIGAFTFAAMFDAITIGRKKPSPAATTLLAVGLASVPVTALAGVLDWQHTGGKTKRVGMGHLALNSFGSVLLALSLVTRLRGRGPARLLNFLGNGVLTASAYLGGHLVYDARVGMKREADSSPPDHFVPVMAEADLKEQTLTQADADGYPLALYRRFGRVYAVADVCPHLGCSLARGSVDGDAIACACHDSRFSLEDGGVLQGPSAFPTSAFTTRVVNGMIEVAPLHGVDR